MSDPERSPEALAYRREVLVLLREIVSALPAAYREVCELRYLQGLSTAETGGLLGISRSNASTRLNRAVGLAKTMFDARLRRNGQVL